MRIKKIFFVTLVLATLFYLNSCKMLFDSEANRSSYTVYVTSSGYAYHRSSCGSIKHSKHVYSMSKGEAEGKGYSRCSKCKP